MIMIHKKRAILYIISAVALHFLFLKTSHAQIADDSYYQSRDGLKNWSLAISGGSNLFYGDLRQYQYYPVMVNNNEWRFAYSAMLHKDLTKVFGLQFRYLNGQLAGTKRSTSQYFNADITEYSMEGTMNFTNIILPNRPYKSIEMYGSAGLGLADWVTEKYNLHTDEYIDGNGHSGNGSNKRTTELVLPVSIGFDINLSPHWALNLENSWRIVNSDVLDATSGGFEYDMYGYTSVGLRFNFTGNGRTKSRKQYAYTGEKIYQYVDEQKKVEASQQDTYVKPRLTEEKECIDTEVKEYNYSYNYPASEPQIELQSHIPTEIFAGDILEISFRIDKGSYNKSASLRQTLPYGVQLLDAQVKGGKVSSNRQMVSVFWLNMPEEDSFTITYTLGTSQVNTGLYPMNGIFTYTEAGTPKQINFKNTIQIKEGSAIQYEEDHIEEFDPNYERVVVEQIERPTEVKPKQVTEGVEFRVQVRAKYGKKISVGAVKASYNITEQVYEDYYKGYYIYTVGSYRSYEEAQRKKEEIRKYHVSDAFVVAFKNGYRVETLSEIMY